MARIPLINNFEDIFQVHQGMPIYNRDIYFKVKLHEEYLYELK